MTDIAPCAPCVLAAGQRFIVATSAFTGGRYYEDEDIKVSRHHYDVMQTNPSSDDVQTLELELWQTYDTLTHSRGHMLHAPQHSLSATQDEVGPAAESAAEPAATQ